MPSDESRTEQVTFYLTPNEHERLKREADGNAVSLSAYCAQLIRRHWQLEEMDRLDDDLNIEERLREVTTEATERIDETVEQKLGDVEQHIDDIHDLQARAATYPLVNFRLLQREFRAPESLIDDEFTRARDRLREPLEQHEPLEGIPASEPADDSDTDSDTDSDDDVDRDGQDTAAGGAGDADRDDSAGDSGTGSSLKDRLRGDRD